MTQNTQKVGPQGTQVFDASDVESMLAKEIAQQHCKDSDQPALIGVSAPYTGRQFLLKETKYRIGRSDDNDIALDDSSVSSAHAQLVYRDGEWVVINLLSSNGTFVNGGKVAETAINVGDRIGFGGVEFMFIHVDTAQTEELDKPGMGLGSKVALIGGTLIIALAAVALYLM
ncbi:FHA domain-containing protein [Pleionea sp. CnH1-48]|uniref:FHA domain-containing protein n=1 Tax=Pleionea sp. CnH1-48 TaxID=2954494 RepID=UPI002096B812|nr:FHA domain-containing protein [Pleionea sp. CnH1-48]MCO7227397.1 FHA domain-containing protein [Pleionea sp. CnH1-48]